MLKFDRKEECSRGIDALHFYASSIAAARCDVTRPEIETALIGNAIEEVQIVLLNEEVRLIDLVDRLQFERTNINGSTANPTKAHTALIDSQWISVLINCQC